MSSLESYREYYGGRFGSVEKLTNSEYFVFISEIYKRLRLIYAFLFISSFLILLMPASFLLGQFTFEGYSGFRDENRPGIESEPDR